MAITQVVDLLSSLSLAKTVAPRPADGGGTSIVAPSDEEQHVEATAGALRFLSSLTDASPGASTAIMQCYPGIILRSCVNNGSPAVVAATAALVRRLAAGGPDNQRYLRLEEVLQRLVPAMAGLAEKVAAETDEAEALVRCPCCVLRGRGRASLEHERMMCPGSYRQGPNLSAVLCVLWPAPSCMLYMRQQMGRV